MFLLRHGESEFNLHFGRTGRDPGIEDPRLTPHGHAQAAAAGAALATAGIRTILASPYTRALQTAQGVAAVLPAPIRIEPVIRERYAYRCDIGSPCTQLAQDWPHHDFSHVDDVWWPQEFEPEEILLARAAAFRTAMRAHPAHETVLAVSHWGFLLALTGRSVMNGEIVDWNPATKPPARIDWDQ